MKNINYKYNEDNEKLIMKNCENQDELEYCRFCFYCKAPLPVKNAKSKTPKAHQHDHFPIPYPAGGKHLVPACLACHQWKDTISLNNWDLLLIEDFWIDLKDAENCKEYFYSLFYFLYPELRVETKSKQWENENRKYLNLSLDDWIELRQGTKLLYAKIVKTYWDNKVDVNWNRTDEYNLRKEIKILNKNTLFDESFLF